MRIRYLPTSRTIALGTEHLPARRMGHPAPTDAPVAGPTPHAGPAAGTLPPPLPAHERRRHLFHPRSGWFRSLERRVNLYLSRNVFHRLPGIHLPYGRQLRRDLGLSLTDMPMPGLPREFDGLRILLISDVHAGAFVSPRTLRETFRRLLAVEPDLVLLAGDLITARVQEFVDHREAFRSLGAPLGVWAVLGNHDHYPEQPERLTRLIEETGIPVLHNRSVALRRADAVLSLAGVDDHLIGQPDLSAALHDTRGPVLLMSHNPDMLFQAARRGVALMVSGHTHAGQVRIPGLPVLVRQSRFRLDEGRYRVADTELVVSRGLGVVGIPLRVACPPEAVLLTLRRAARQKTG